MKILDTIHGGYVHSRRVRILADHLARLIPAQACLLDVGCGDGALDALVLRKRPDLQVQGIDVLVRPDTAIPVRGFDGRAIPYPDRTFDCITFVDVLHHTHDPMALLREAARVARTAIVIKDHCRDGLLAGPTLRFMDHVGNARHGVALPYNYWPERRWRAAFADLRLAINHWSTGLGLYPWWAAWLFGRRLHFIARLDIGH